MTADPPRVLGDILDLQRGTTYKSQLLGQPGATLLGLASIARNGGFKPDGVQTYGGASPERISLRPGDMYVSLKDVTQSADLLGAVARVPTHITIGRLTQDTVKLVLRHTAPPRQFVYWWLRTPQYRDYCRARATGTTNLSLSRSDFLAYPLPTPTPQQLSLVSLLDHLEEKIELNRQMRLTLEDLFRALFRSCFIDFDPVGGLEGLSKSDLQRLSDGTAPPGWRHGKLREVATNPRRQVRFDKIDADTAYVALDHLPRRSLSIERWGNADRVTSGKFQFERGEILFGKLRPYFHKVAVAPLAGVCSTDILVVAPATAAWFGLVLGFVSSDSFVSYATSFSNGTKMPRTNWSDMGNYAIVIPPLNVAAAFTSRIRPLVERIIALTHESKTLRDLRDAVLPQMAHVHIDGTMPHRES